MVAMDADDPRPPLLFDLIKEKLSPAEHDEAQRMLGAVVDQIYEIQAEIDALTEIWMELRRDNDLALLRRSKARTRSASTLPEPPIRDMLEKEIRYFITNLERRATERGLPTAGTVASQKDRGLYDYVMRPATASSSSRPSTARPSTASSGRPVSRGGLSSTSASSAGEPALSEFTDVFSMEAVIKKLQSAMEQEKEFLLAEVDWLRDCIDQEADYGHEAADEGDEELLAPQQPSIGDLREYSSRLQNEWMLQNPATPKKQKALPPTTPPSASARKFAAAAAATPDPATPVKRPSTAQKLRAIVQTARED